MAGWHMQRTFHGWLNSVHLLPNSGFVKACEDYQMFLDVKSINPNIFTAHRMVRDPWQVYHGHVDSPWFVKEEAERIAREWFNAFIDGTFVDVVAPVCDAVSWHNEIWANSQNSVEQLERVAATEAAVNVWNREFRPFFLNDIKLIVGEAAVGNWMPRRVAELAIQTDNLLGYHPYEWWWDKVRADYGHRGATSMLWDVMEFDWGLKPNWIFTEAGPLEGAVTGWRSPKCLGGDRELYVEAVRLWMEDVSHTPAYAEGRIRGFCLFTTFTTNDPSWGTFHTAEPEMQQLAQMFAENWKPGTYVPGPTPPPGDDFEQRAWEVTAEMQRTGQNGLRLNSEAGIQQQISDDNYHYGSDYQIVTSETILDGRTIQKAEALGGDFPPVIYVWKAGEEIYTFEEDS